MNDDVARNRFFMINAVRIAGMVTVLIGIAIHYRKIDLPEQAALPLALIGMAGFFFLPRLLASKWRTPGE